MKKLVGMMIAGVAVIGLSGCNPVQGDNDIQKIDITNLSKGYEILGNGSKGKQVSIEFCYDRYAYKRNGALVEEGDVNIVNGKIELSKIDMIPDTVGSYAIETDTGYLQVGDDYEIAGVEWLNPLTAILRINCY